MTPDRLFACATPFMGRRARRLRPPGVASGAFSARTASLGVSLLMLGLAACSPPGNPEGTGPAAPTTGVSPSSASSRPLPSDPLPAQPGPSGPAPGGSRSPTPPGDARPAGGCGARVSRLSLAERVGQLLMVAVSSTGLTPSVASVLSRTHAGGVLLLGNSSGGAALTGQVVADVRAAARRPERVQVVLAVDQEGGLVQRLSGRGFSDIPAAVDQARLSDARLARDAATWGRELARAGIDVNLAPVADVVPPDLVRVNEPVGRLRRGYGSSPRKVASKVTAFLHGMDAAGIGTAVKHFPGLGRVRGNTDFEQGVVDRVTRRRDPALRGFSAAVDGGVDMVMMSSAVYARIDPARQAVFSPAVVSDMVRGDLGFDGVVISDDLAAAAVSRVPAGRRAVDFLRAGGDLVIVGDPALAAPMAAAVVERAGADPAFAERVDQSARRVLALKARRGLARC